MRKRFDNRSVHQENVFFIFLQNRHMVMHIWQHVTGFLYSFMLVWRE